jgi:uncharacterized protein
MESKMIWANFSVKDVERTRKFYTALGFKPNGMNYPQLASFFFADTNLVIHFFEQGSQIDEYLAPGQQAGSEVIFTLSSESEAEVNEWAERVKNAGGTIVKEAGRDATNHYGFAFADPDGHQFNILLVEKGM